MMNRGLPLAPVVVVVVVAALLSAHGLSVRAQPVASIALPEPGGSVQLYAGCNNIALTFPDGTASDAVVQAVTPGEAVQAMWRHDAPANRFEGFSPAAPQASDLLTVDFLDAVWLCVAGAPPAPTAASVPMFRGNPARTGVNPGPGVQRSPKLLWRFQTGGPVDSSPAVVQGTVYVNGGDPLHLYAVDATTGEERWRVETGLRMLGFSPYSSPAVVDQVVYVGAHFGDVYALEAATGERLWRAETGALDVRSSPAVVDGVVYIGGKEFVGAEDNAYVYALDAQTGRRRWHFETEGATVSSSPAVADGMVYVGAGFSGFDLTGDRYVYALDADSGEERWRFETGDVVGSSPAVADGVVYIGSWDSYVYALDADTGEELWRFEADGPVQSSPAVVDAVLYIGSNSDWLTDSSPYVYALDATTGEERWRFETGQMIVSSPAVVDGVVYIASHDGYVYAITGE